MAVTQESAKVKYVAYGLRGPAALRQRCAQIAAAETRATGYPVSTSAIMRKLIQEGVDKWAQTKGQGR